MESVESMDSFTCMLFLESMQSMESMNSIKCMDFMDAMVSMEWDIPPSYTTKPSLKLVVNGLIAAKLKSALLRSMLSHRLDLKGFPTGSMR